jgi:DNA-binding transcriptional ArsR family regulator
MLSELATNTDSVHTVARVMRLLSDPTRLRLLGLLRLSERTVGDLCESLDIPQPSVSHHLSLMRRAGLVLNRRAGRHVYYALNPATVNSKNGQVEMALTIGPAKLRIQITRNDGAGVEVVQLRHHAVVG